MAGRVLRVAAYVPRLLARPLLLTVREERVEVELVAALAQSLELVVLQRLCRRDTTTRTDVSIHVRQGRAGGRGAASRWRSVPTSEGLHHDADLLDGDAALALLVKERKDLAVLIALLRLQLVLWRARDYE